MIDNEKA